MNTDRCYQIFDIGTRTRNLNKRESKQLQEKIKDLSFKQHSAFYQHVLDQNQLKIKLHEYSYEGGQRDFYKSLTKRSRENSTATSTSRSDSSEENDNLLNSSSLLLHDLNSSIEFENKLPLLNLNITNRVKKLNPYDEFCQKYCSKLDNRRSSVEKPISMSLKQYSERMKIDIKTAIARAARNSHTLARRDSRVY